jgi:hypothetical protein
VLAQALADDGPAMRLVAALGLLALSAGDLPAQASQFALRFFGTGTSQQDRVRIAVDDDLPGSGGNTPLDVGRGSFTIEFWLRGRLQDNGSSSSGGDREFTDNRWISGNIVVDRDIWGGSNRDFGISIAGGFVRFGTGPGDGAAESERTLEGNAPVLDDRWHHIACVRDAASGERSVWVDGALDFASTSGGSRADLSYPDDGVPNQNTPWGPFLVLAAEKHDAGPAFPSFAGFLDEVRVWNVARSAAEIAASWSVVLPAGTPGLVGSYRFEEGAGTALLDGSGTGSPAGELIAARAGNGEWAAYATDPANTAPVTGGGPLEDIAIGTQPAGLAIEVNGIARATPLLLRLPRGTAVDLQAPQLAVAARSHAFAAWSHRAARAHRYVVPAGGATLRAIYVPTASSSVAVSVAAAARNAEHHPATGQAFGNAFDANGICCGRDGSGAYQAGFAFALPIPRAAAIVAAALRVVATADQSGAPTARLRAYDTGDAPAFVPGSNTPLNAHAPLTAAAATWVFPPFAPGSTHVSPSLAPLVQAVVARGDWSPGNHLGIVLEPTSAGTNDWRCMRNFASGQPPILDVMFGAGGARGAFTDIGPGIRGAIHAPSLGGAGDLAPGNREGFVLFGLDAPNGAPVVLVLGGTLGGLPLFGGTFYPNPVAAALPLGIADASGALALYTAMPANVAPGSALVAQSWLLDASAPFGFTASNGLRLDVP